MLANMVACVLLSVLSAPVDSGVCQPDELAEMRCYFEKAFQVEVTNQEVHPRFTIETSHDLVQKNAHRGHPLTIHGVPFTRGLYTHAPTRLKVFLDGPARSFHATLGVDDNDQTRIGKSSVEFTVTAGADELFRSPVMHFADPALVTNVNLESAAECVLELTNAGDGIHSDQGVWGEAWFEMADGRKVWLDDLPAFDSIAKASDHPPFSFTLDGKDAWSLLKGLEPKRALETLDRNRLRYSMEWSDPSSGLVVVCEAIQYPAFPVVEWTVRLRNEGTSNSPLIENLNSLDLHCQRHPLLPEYEFILHRNRGTVVTTMSVPEGKRDWEPSDETLNSGSKREIIPPQGRPSAGEWPYFNIESMGNGIIFAVGWPGQWAARFERDDQAGLHLLAGQATASFRLQPGEEVRTPRIALQFWRGSRTHSQNVWRRWMLANVVPRPGGKALQPMSGAFCGYYFPELQISEEGELQYMSRFIEAGIIPDYWWIDAGWYPCKGSWVNTGTWKPDPERFPKGLSAVTSVAKQYGMKSIVWFEPERVTSGSWLYENHPEWLLPSKPEPGETCLLNLGNSAAREWLINHYDKLIRESGIDLYRQDFNMAPLPCWESGDGEGRKGICENHHVQGYLAFWDALLERHPNLLIDTCASGAHRDDLETLRRSVPLWRSDWAWEPTSMQCQTYGLAQWIPYFGTGAVSEDPYNFYSDMTPFMLFSWDMKRKDLNYEDLHHLAKVWKEAAPFYLGDFYPLTPYSLAEDVWLAWQFHRDDMKAGLVQVFRRKNSIYEAARLKLSGLEDDKVYTLHRLDQNAESLRMTGTELRMKGLPVVSMKAPEAVIWVYAEVVEGRK